MRFANANRIRLVLAGAVLTVAVGCHKKPQPPILPPMPATPAGPAVVPTVTIQANPTAIQRGQSTLLSWNSEHAVSLELNGRRVNLTGSQQVAPQASTDYTALARDTNGATATASVRVTVTEPPAPVTPQPTSEDLGQSFDTNVKDVFFDYDQSGLRADGEAALRQDADFLKAHPDLAIVIEGHCDERGSAEYNIALGDRRANAVRDYLVRLGVDGSRVKTVSYGKEKPFCAESNEECWQQNRRAHLARVQ